ncbi:MAG: glycosyltransferase [bacterium]
MLAKNPKVSVCIPNYNYGHFIGDAIRSVLAQTYKDFELIIVDNCSADNSEEVIKSFRDPRIRFYKNEKNIGMTANWNKCLSLARGEYISILHADDVYLPNFLEEGVKVLDTNPKVGMVYSQVKYINDKGKVIGDSRGLQPLKSYVLAGEKEFQKLVTHSTNIFCPAVMVRKSIYNAIGNFDESFSLASDYDMWLRISLNYDVAFISQPLACYRVHEDSETTLNLNMLVKEDYEVLKKTYSNLSKEKQYFRNLVLTALRRISKKNLWIAIKYLSRGENETARKYISSYIIENSSSMGVYILLLLTYLGWIGKVIIKTGMLFSRNYQAKAMLIKLWQTL